MRMKRPRSVPTRRHWRKSPPPGLDRIVALKILAPELGRDPAFAERFAREARTLGKLHHPNIVTVFEHGESGGYFYLIMEYVDGVNLRQAMRAGRFTPEQALAIVPGICDALQAAHAQGVWHRDIKPENILLDREGKVKIADFGIARIVGDPRRDFTLTLTGNALGSAAYMAPEQHEKPHDVDHRADIYSLGVVIYEMLTGELPLGRFPLPSQRAEVGKRIDEIVLRTLEKERELRQQSADEVKTDIERRDNPTSIATVQTKPRMFLARIAIVLLILGLYGAFSINRLFPQAGNPVLMVSLGCLALAMIMGLFSWRHALGRWTTILTLICIGIPVAKSLIAWRSPEYSSAISRYERVGLQRSEFSDSIEFMFFHPLAEKGGYSIIIPLRVSESWIARNNEPIRLRDGSDVWVRGRVIQVDRGTMKATVSSSNDSKNWTDAEMTLDLVTRKRTLRMDNGVEAMVRIVLAGDNFAEIGSAELQIRMAVEELLSAARERNSHVFQSRLSRSFKELLRMRKEDSGKDFGDFGRVQFLESKQLDDRTAEVVVEATDGSKRRVTFRMILEDGMWKLTEDGL
jgi:serine/threonine protein kinase